MATVDGYKLPSLAQAGEPSRGRPVDGTVIVLAQLAHADVTPPAISDHTPSPSATIDRDDEISFDLADVGGSYAGGIRSVWIAAKFTGLPWEVVYDDEDPGTGYTVDDGGYASGDDSASFAFSRDSGWPTAAMTVRVVAVDTSGNRTESEWSYTVSNPPTGPVFQNKDPAPAGTIDATDPATVDVVDDDLADLFVYATFGTAGAEIIYDGTGFVVPYDVDSDWTEPSLSIVRDGGWHDAAVTIHSRATDAAGNATTDTWAFVVSDPAAGDGPTVTLVSPADGAILDPHDAITVEVVDADGLLTVPLLAVYPGGDYDVVHDGTSFASKYRFSTRTSITNGYRYVITRVFGWHEPPIIRYRPVDTAGNQTP